MISPARCSKNGSHYTSINLGVSAPSSFTMAMTALPLCISIRESNKDDAAKPSATVVDLVHRPLDKPRATASKGFFNDQLPECWKDGHIA